MNAYSPDLRERVIAAAREPNVSQPEVAARFSISLSSVEDWLRTFRHTRRVQALPCAGGKKRMLQPYGQVIREAVAQQPDATLAEWCAMVLAKTGVAANASRMCRELQILKLPRKKVTARQSARNPARPKTAPGLSRTNDGDTPRHRGTPEIHRCRRSRSREKRGAFGFDTTLGTCGSR